jgi:hypothetical protein
VVFLAALIMGHSYKRSFGFVIFGTNAGGLFFVPTDASN